MHPMRRALDDVETGEKRRVVQRGRDLRDTRTAYRARASRPCDLSPNEPTGFAAPSQGLVQAEPLPRFEDALVDRLGRTTLVHVAVPRMRVVHDDAAAPARDAQLPRVREPDIGSGLVRPDSDDPMLPLLGEHGNQRLGD